MKQTYISPDIQLVKVDSTTLMEGSNTFNGNNIEINPGTMNQGKQDAFKSAQFRWFEEEGEF